MNDTAARYVLRRDELQHLVDLLIRRGYEVLGPTVRDGAILYDTVRTLEDLPAGWTDEQAPGRYRLKRRADGALFGYVVGPHSWKKYLHPAEVRLLSAERNGQTFRILNQPPAVTKRAFLGVRACELAAIGIQDRVLLEDRYCDPIYASNRSSLFIIAVNCTQAAPTCFCTSMGTDPRATKGYDLALTELISPDSHEFLVESGSEAGRQILTELSVTPASEAAISRAGDAIDAASSQIQRRMDTTNIREALYSSFDHPQWDKVAERCLSCANCTMVCPTCFCTTVEDVSDVSGNHAERWRKWDSCFTQNFSYIHGGSVRSSAKSRYRQWMTHKLASWIDQFGSSGCVGCGRCITWCPVGIDITEEVRAIRTTPSSTKGTSHGNS